MHAPLCKLNYLLTRKSNVYRDHNTSPPSEVQLFTSTWSLKQLPLPIFENLNTPNSFIRDASLNDCAYVAAYVPYPRDQAIHSLSKRAPRAQAIVTKSLAANRICWIIWTSLPIPSWRKMAFNCSCHAHQLEIHASSPNFVVLSWFQELQIIWHSYQYVQPVQYQKLATWSPPVSHPVESLLIPDQLEVWLVSKISYFISHLHIYLILNLTNNTSLACS